MLGAATPPYAAPMVSELFDPEAWRPVEGFDLTDISYHRHVELGCVRIAFDRPEVRNAFRPSTVDELYRVLDHARQSSDVGCVLLTGNGPSPRDGGWAFCSGGDQRIRGKDGYRYAGGDTADTIDVAPGAQAELVEYHVSSGGKSHSASVIVEVAAIFSRRRVPPSPPPT